MFEQKKRRKIKSTSTQLFVYALSCTCSDWNFHRTIVEIHLFGLLFLFFCFLFTHFTDNIQYSMPFAINYFCFRWFGSFIQSIRLDQCREMGTTATFFSLFSFSHISVARSTDERKKKTLEKRQNERNKKKLRVCFRLSLLKLGFRWRLKYKSVFQTRTFSPFSWYEWDEQPLLDSLLLLYA